MENPPNESLAFLLHDASRSIRKRFELEGSAYGLSAAQWRLLAVLVKEEGASQARLAELLEIEPISVSRLIDRMVDGGWVQRRADASDRRLRVIFPTPRARDAYVDIKSMAGKVYAAALAGLSAEEAQTLMRGLATIAANLSDGTARS